MISILAVIFFSYQNITEEFMRTVNCVDLDKDKSDNDVSDYTGFAIARGRYWGEDTAEKCYEGGHGNLAMFLGVPGLLLFSFGVPVFLLVLLLWNQHHGRLKHREFLNTYGFVYQNYTEKHVYWEVVILIRKALIGGVVVFAYEAGPNLQGIMALGVLIAALVMHLIAVPFKYTTLNVLEGCSLIVSILTFYSGIVFDDGNTSPSAKILLSVILFVVNTGMTLYLLYKITQYVDQYVTARLKVVGVEDVPRSFPARCWRLLQTIVEQIATGEGRGRTLASVAQLTMQVMPNTGRGARPQQEKALPTTADVGMARS